MTKFAIITGAAGGIATQTINSLLPEWKIIAIVRKENDKERLNQVSGVKAFKLDLTEINEIESVVKEILEYVKGKENLKLIVHTAAAEFGGPLETAAKEDWIRILRTNFLGPVLLTKNLLPSLRKSEGTIIFINSGAGEHAIENLGVYGSSKFALRDYADVLRIEESKNKIRVTTIFPGQVDTKMLRASATKIGFSYNSEEVIKPSTVAKTIAFVANAPQDVQITNIVLRPRQELGNKFNV